MHIKAASRLAPRTLSWLWPGRLVLGKLAMLDGDPGLGKSHLALDLCARLSGGRPMPDGQPGPGVCNSLYLNAEDNGRDTIRPRLLALGADLDRVFVLDRDDEPDGLLSLPTQTAQLDDALAQTRARLVVLDPVISFLDSSVNEASNQSVRRALLPLADLAEKYTALMVMVRHLNKRGAGSALYRGAGSIGFLGLCRSGWLLASDPEDRTRRVLAQVKNTLGPPQPSLCFSLVPREDGRADLCWQGESPLAADELLATRREGPPSMPRDDARDFLSDFLSAGPRTSRDIWAAALERGLSQRTLFRARKELGVRVEAIYEGKRRWNYWLLSNQQLSTASDPESDEFDLEPWLAPLREKYPPPTPLDDL